MSTVPSRDAGLVIANVLVENRLAACVNIIPGLTSVYIWKDKLCTDEEHLLIIKSRKELFIDLRDAIKMNHPYEVPEIVSIPVTDGFAPYLKWIGENTSK